MSSFPSFTDIIFISIIIIPGYIVLKIIRYFAGIKRKISDLDLTFSSIVFSIVVYGLTGIFLKIYNYEDLKNRIIEADGIIIIFGITCFIGLILGLITYTWRVKERYVPDDTWISVIKKFEKKYKYPWVIICTKDNKEYKGILNYYAIEDEERVLSIIYPKLIFRDKDFKWIDDLEMGEEIYFSKDNIQRIIFLKQK
jgi:hypothetical protein